MIQQYFSYGLVQPPTRNCCFILVVKILHVEVFKGEILAPCQANLALLSAQLQEKHFWVKVDWKNNPARIMG